MYRWFYIILFGGACVLVSCSDYPCTSGDMRIGLIGFSDDEADTIILRRFTKNTSDLKDTFLVDHIGYRRNSDTLKLVATPGIISPTIEYDYEYYFPAAGKLLKITNIIEEQLYIRKKWGGTKEGCMNRISSYHLNGIQVQTSGFGETYFRK